MKRSLPASLAVAAMLGGVGAAAALGGGHSREPASHGAGFVSLRHAGPGAPGLPLQTVAAYLGLSVGALRGDLRGGQTLAQVAAANGRSADGLVQALVAAAKTRLDAAVAAGKLSQAQEDAILPQLQQRFAAVVNGAPPGRVRGPGHAVAHGGLQAAAAYLGLSAAALGGDLRSGQTLAQVAAANGRSADGLVQALVAAAKTRLDAAVAAGKLSQAQEDAILPQLQQRIAVLVNGSFRHWPPASGV